MQHLTKCGKRMLELDHELNRVTTDFCARFNQLDPSTLPD